MSLPDPEEVKNSHAEREGKVPQISRRQWLWRMTKAYWKPAMLVLTPLAALPLPLASGLNRDWCAYMMIIMAVYWVLELLPLAATAVIPVVMCPMLGLLGTSEVSMQYMTGSNMLFVGGKIQTVV